LVTILPAVLTVYLLYWLSVSAEKEFGRLIRLLIPQEVYRPGMGVAVGLAGIFVVGLLMQTYLAQRIFGGIERILYRTPLIRSVYAATRDFIDYFSPTKKREFEQVVAVSIGDTGMEVIGFVTQAVPDRLPEGFRKEDSVLVYLPLSYMIGGYTVLMPRSAIRPLKMSMEEAMRFTLTAGVTSTGTSARAVRTGS